MIEVFKSETEARQYIKQYSKGLTQVETNIITELGEDIIKQVHFAFYDFEEQTQHTVSLIEREHGFTVRTSLLRESSLVQACELGDMDLVQESLQRSNSDKAIALAFVTSIYNDRDDFVKLFMDNGKIFEVVLFKNPLETTTVKDSINSFRLLVARFEIPDELLARILFNNSHRILKYILSDENLIDKILNQDRLQTKWTRKMLSNTKHRNQTVDLYLNAGYN